MKKNVLGGGGGKERGELMGRVKGLWEMGAKGKGEGEEGEEASKKEEKKEDGEEEEEGEETSEPQASFGEGFSFFFFPDKTTITSPNTIFGPLFSLLSF